MGGCWTRWSRPATFFAAGRGGERKQGLDSCLAVRRMIKACFETNARCELANGAGSVESPGQCTTVVPDRALCRFPRTRRRQEVSLPINRFPSAHVTGHALPRSSPAALLAGARSLRRHTRQHRPIVLSTQTVDSSPSTHPNCVLGRGSLAQKCQSRNAIPLAPPGDICHPFCLTRIDGPIFSRTPQPPMSAGAFPSACMKGYIEHDFNEKMAAASSPSTTR